MTEDEISTPQGAEAPQEAGDQPVANDELTTALESTLGDLTQSISRMEAIIHQLEAGGADWDESVRLITEANELAISSSQRLDRVVQDVVYGSSDAADSDDEAHPQQESLDLP